MKPSRVIVASDHVAFGDALEAGLREQGWNVLRLSSAKALQETSIRNAFIFLDTNDDNQLMIEIVNHLYKRVGKKHALPIVGICSTQALNTGPPLGMWVVGGHAAIAGGITYPRDQCTLQMLLDMMTIVDLGNTPIQDFDPPDNS